MKRILLPVLTILFASSLAFAQVEFEDYVRSIGENTRGNTIFTKKAVETQGDPYSKEGWMKGKFHREGLITKAVKFRMNQHQGILEVENRGQLIAIDDKDVEMITVTEPLPMKFKNGFDTRKERGVDESSLFEVLHEGTVTILRRENISLQKDMASYGTATQKDRYIRSDAYYATNEDSFKKIRLRDKDLLKFYPKNIHKEIKDYVKRNNLKWDNESHLKMILNFAEDRNTEGES